MLKYKLKANPIQDFSFSYVADYLKSLGIENPDSFLKEPRLEDQEHYNKLINIDKAVQSLYEGFKQNKKFFMQVDSDTDGYTSASIFFSFFREIFPEAKIEWRLHEQKEHGVMLDTIPIDADYVIIPDAGSIQFDEQEELSRKGYKVIIIDHHNVSNPPKLDNVILVNNQISPEFKNKGLSGAGMVYKVIQAFNKTYENEFPLVYEKYADLASLGIISDMMDTRTPDNNYIIRKGLDNVANPMFRAFLEKQSYSVSDIDKPNKIDIAFYVAPLINAVIRFGTGEEKETLFKGFIESNVNNIVETEYRGELRRENFYDFVARTSANVRGRQNREKEKSLNFLSQKVNDTGADKNQLLVVIVSRDDEVTVPHTITGLVAMELLKKYKKPTLVLRPKSDGKGGILYAGSGRGKANGEFDSLFGMLRESNLCEYVEGHDMAHGVAVSHDNLPRLIDFANEYLSEIQFDVDEIEVDYIFGNSNINYQMLYDFGSAIHIYGNGIPQPKFGFNLRVSKDAITTMGKKGDTFKISLNGITFIKFGAAEILQKMEDAKSHLFEFKFVGRAQINEWNNKSTPQIMIDEIDVEAIELDSLF